MSDLTIKFYVTHGGIKHEISCRENEYRNLMSLLYDRFYFDNFGECKGIGRCGTCHVKVETGPESLLTRKGNEETTLGKMDNIEITSRLSCQILLTHEINACHFVIQEDMDPGLY